MERMDDKWWNHAETHRGADTQPALFFFSAVLRCGGQAWDTQYFGPLCPSERFQKITML